MDARRRATTMPAVLKSRSLGTLVAGIANSLAATEANNNQREQWTFQKSTGSSLRAGVTGSMLYVASSRSTAASSTVVGADGVVAGVLFLMRDVMKLITMWSPRARFAGGG